MPSPIPAHLKGERKFEPGTLTVTSAAQEALRAARLSVEVLVARHCTGDFGELSSDDAMTCRSNILNGGHVTSIYAASGFSLGLKRERIWVCSLLREGWTHVCIESEAHSLF